MPVQGRPRFISVLVYKMYKRLASAPEGIRAFPGPLYGLSRFLRRRWRWKSGPRRNGLLDKFATRQRWPLLRISNPTSVLPSRSLGLSVPTMRAIVATFAKAHKRLTATELNALGAALWSD